MEKEVHMKRNCFIVLLWLVSGSGGFAREVAGVTLPENMQVGEKNLKLNGMGLRTMFIFGVKVYVAGLYLENPSKDAAGVIAGEQVKTVKLTFLRHVDRSKIADSIGEGFERNSKDQMKALKARLEKLQSFIPDVEKGDHFQLTYLPGKGMVISVNGTEKGVIEGKDFSAALFSVWLGADPVDADLKKALLGA
jgi:hypothetical protein